MKSILTIIGTRPEAIKLIPVLLEIKKNKNFQNKICVTSQHVHLLDTILQNYDIKVDYKLNKQNHNFDLTQSAAHILTQISPVLIMSKPELVLVQGDTTTAFIAALAAFYSQIPVVHIEAGLRTGHIYSPWPEEVHRRLIDRLSTYYFAPTIKAQNLLISEGVHPEKIWVVGNTSIDALKQINQGNLKETSHKEPFIIVTFHRRENQGKPLREICDALCKLVKQIKTIRVIFFLHPNPSIRKSATALLSGIEQIDLIEPYDHASFIELLKHCIFIITDSGGIQEEAPFLGKPVLVVRDTTERPEGVIAGTTKLVGTDSKNILDACKELLGSNKLLSVMSKIHYPYGDGYAANRIVSILDKQLEKLPA